MLVLSRKVGDSIVIGESIEVVVTKVSGNRTSIGVKAPGNVRIRRGELSFKDRFDPNRGRTTEDAKREGAPF